MIHKHDTTHKILTPLFSAHRVCKLSYLNCTSCEDFEILNENEKEWGESRKEQHTWQILYFVAQVSPRRCILGNECWKRQKWRNRLNLINTAAKSLKDQPANKLDQSNFEAVPVPLDFCVHSKLLYLASAIDVVGESLPQSMRVSSNKIPPAYRIGQLHTKCTGRKSVRLK